MPSTFVFAAIHIFLRWCCWAELIRRVSTLRTPLTLCCAAVSTHISATHNVQTYLLRHFQRALQRSAPTYHYHTWHNCSLPYINMHARQLLADLWEIWTRFCPTEATHKHISQSGWMEAIWCGGQTCRRGSEFCKQTDEMLIDPIPLVLLLVFHTLASASRIHDT